MGLAPKKRTYTFEEYLALEEKSQVKHQFYYGEIRAMAGTTKVHNQIVGNCFVALHTQKKKECYLFFESVKVEVDFQKTYFYPDLEIEMKVEDIYRNVGIEE